MAVYAVKTTTDPDTPQEVATVDEGKKALMKEIFWAMNEIGSRTETSTTTQTKETDDGAGNIIEKEVEVTEIVLHITVTHKTAEEMADAYHFTATQRMQLAELLDGKNSDMWSAVLYGLGAGDREIVAVALSQLGNIGGEPYWAWYGFGSQVDWCACFVSWCANECGYLERGVIPKFASCAVGIQWFQTRGQWQDGDYEPRPGDLIFFDWNDKGMGQDGIPDHVGIVQKMENGIVGQPELEALKQIEENYGEEFKYATLFAFRAGLCSGFGQYFVNQDIVEDGFEKRLAHGLFELSGMQRHPLFFKKREERLKLIQKLEEVTNYKKSRGN